MLKQDKYKLSNNTKDIILNYFRAEKTKEHFSNGRLVRNFVERLKFAQANRIALDDTQDINLIKKCDVENVLVSLESQSKNGKKQIGFAI